MTHQAKKPDILRLKHARLTLSVAPHKVADNDNDDPPAVPAQAFAAMTVEIAHGEADGLLM